MVHCVGFLDFCFLKIGNKVVRSAACFVKHYFSGRNCPARKEFERQKMLSSSAIYSGMALRNQLIVSFPTQWLYQWPGLRFPVHLTAVHKTTRHFLHNQCGNPVQFLSFHNSLLRYFHKFRSTGHSANRSVIFLSAHRRRLRPCSIQFFAPG